MVRPKENLFIYSYSPLKIFANIVPMARVADQSWGGEEASKQEFLCKMHASFINHVGICKVKPTEKLFIYS